MVTVTVYSIQAVAASGKRTSPLPINHESGAALADGFLSEYPIHSARGRRAEVAAETGVPVPVPVSGCLAACLLGSGCLIDPGPARGPSRSAAAVGGQEVSWLCSARFHLYSLPRHLPGVPTHLLSVPWSCDRLCRGRETTFPAVVSPLYPLSPKGCLELPQGAPPLPVLSAGCWVQRREPAPRH